MKLLAFSDVGTLVVGENYLEFKGKKENVHIANIRRISYGKQGRDFVNNWVKIEYDNDKTAFFADGDRLGWKGIFGGTEQILEAVQHLKPPSSIHPTSMEIIGTKIVKDGDDIYGKKLFVPDEIKGWNWGAFLLSWIWGLGNDTYISFLVFIPIFGLAWSFVLGVKGNEWAWQNRTWRSVEQFKKTQKTWAIAGTIITLLELLITVCAILISASIP